MAKSSGRLHPQGEIGQFRSISLLNVEGKVFFSILAKIITNFLLENGSVPHQLLNYTTEFFHMPGSIRSLVSNYFKDLWVAFSLQEFTTWWQQLEVGIAMGCSISPIPLWGCF
ncbi:hypothetical protein QQF64_034694 [Cirrhinus molitorella]|uniref:Uncharacterized protein n=1 Tax=Cirrhinus molitorella TaxID=172907 RepID=A0ABR3L5B2_9TELE